MRIAMTLLALALALGACKKKENQTANATGSATTQGSATAGSNTQSGSGAMGSAGSAAMTGSDTGSAAMDTAMAKHAGNCPSTVLGSTTKAEVKGKDVVVMVTSDDKDAV